MRLNRTHLGAVILLSSVNVFGISPAEPEQFVLPSEMSPCHFFIMLPGQSDPEAGQPRGVAYKVDRAGNMEVLWRVNGWYSWSTNLHLSGSGQLLVRQCDIFPQNNKTIKDQPFLEFYQVGKRIKTYRVSELIDPSKVQEDTLRSGYSKLVIVESRSGGFGSRFLPFSALPGYVVHAIQTQARKQGTAEIDGAKEVFGMQTVGGEFLVFSASDAQLLWRGPTEMEFRSPGNPETDPGKIRWPR